MSDDRYLGIKIPFEEDLKGKYLKLTNTFKDAIRSDLFNLITTMKGERLYKPDFGTNLMKFLFEPMDDTTYNNIKTEILDAVTKYLKEVKILKVEVNSNESNLFVGFRISYTISDGIFKETDELSITF